MQGSSSITTALRCAAAARWGRSFAEEDVYKRQDYDRMADLAGQLGYPSTGRQVRIRLDEMANSNHYAVYVAELPGGRIAGWIGMYVFRSVEQDRTR